eukprot:TRINITY_DN97568_c0_g1_i1.p1 TRINITY_DN97568_c0_g1~~TRINITY_DN97568_c0_g1_i1.p1  ORF type:complete len:136 (-),score=25.02 TRINITY_DN97568_c0_g1_i1:21-428(-)
MGDKKAFDALVACQTEMFPKILTELDEGCKESCWAWYVFPTEKAGMCDPDDTRITKANAKDLFTTDTAESWQKILEKACDLLEKCGKVPPDSSVFPRVDHGRIHFFIKFWKDYDGSPDWMKTVCERLVKFNWPPR